MRGVLDIVSDDRVRTAHMEAMIDSAARRVSRLGEARCLQHAICALRDDPVRAELVVVLAAAVAWADNEVTPEEQTLFEQLAEGLDIGQERAQAILDHLLEDHP
jgi:tellurite resistance protein